jgi:hypothetical protein
LIVSTCRARDYSFGHEVRDWSLQDFGAALADCSQEIALRHDARDLVVISNNDPEVIQIRKLADWVFSWTKVWLLILCVTCKPQLGCLVKKQARL